MSKAVVLVLEPRFESEYGEYANLAVLNAHGDVIGWAGGEVPESGHPCEHNVMDDEGFTLCASSSEIMRLRQENARLRDLLQDVAVCASGKYCYGCPHQYDGCDRDERLRAEGIEV